MKLVSIRIASLLAIVSSSIAFAPSPYVAMVGTSENDKSFIPTALSMAGGGAGRSSSSSSMTTSTSSTAAKPNPIIKLAANGMSLLKPIFAAEAYIQAALLGALANVDKDDVASNIETLKKENNVLIYTYGLSPFSTEALSILDAAGCTYKNVELGLEWFLLGGVGSETRVALSREVDSGATSLPKIFIGGECVGGYAELASLVENGELEEKLKMATNVKKSGSNGMPNLFAGLFK